MKFLWAVCLLILGMNACTPSNPSSPSTVGTYDQAYPDYAQGFFWKNDADTRVLHILSGQRDTLRYFLYKDASQLSKLPNACTPIQVPLSSLALCSSTQLPLLKVLGAMDRLSAVGKAAYIWNPEVLAKIKDGAVAEIGDEQTWDMEQILQLSPQVIMVANEQSVVPANQQLLAKMKITVLPNLEWQESHPLGRAEWIKVMGALIGKDSLATAYFSEIANEYHRLRTLVSDGVARPLALSGIPYQGVWYVPGGKSFMAQLMHDAGARYEWADVPQTASLALDFEAVYPAAMRADIWLLPSSVTRRSELSAMDQRYTAFPSYKAGQVFANSARINASGSNDYYESGVLNPHLILADLIHIIHPSLLPEHQLYYYQALE